MQILFWTVLIFLKHIFGLILRLALVCGFLFFFFLKVIIIAYSSLVALLIPQLSNQSFIEILTRVFLDSKKTVTALGDCSVQRNWKPLYSLGFCGAAWDGRNGFGDTELSCSSHFDLKTISFQKTWILNPLSDNVTNFSNLEISVC